MENTSAAPLGAYSIPEFAQAFKLGRSTVYELIAAGELRSYVVGRRRLISYQAAADWQRAAEQKAFVSA